MTDTYCERTDDGKYGLHMIEDEFGNISSSEKRLVKDMLRNGDFKDVDDAVSTIYDYLYGKRARR